MRSVWKMILVVPIIAGCGTHTNSTSNSKVQNATDTSKSNRSNSVQNVPSPALDNSVNNTQTVPLRSPTYIDNFNTGGYIPDKPTAKFLTDIGNAFSNMNFINQAGQVFSPLPYHGIRFTAQGFVLDMYPQYMEYGNLHTALNGTLWDYTVSLKKQPPSSSITKQTLENLAFSIAATFQFIPQSGLNALANDASLIQQDPNTSADINMIMMQWQALNSNPLQFAVTPSDQKTWLNNGSPVNDEVPYVYQWLLSLVKTS